MSRINTNVTATVAVNTLNKNNTALNTSLERLSTGYRINSGKDDPAGLIASESLKSEQKATETAISNAQRADNIIGTAEGALSEVSNLLVNLQGLIGTAATAQTVAVADTAAPSIITITGQRAVLPSTGVAGFGDVPAARAPFQTQGYDSAVLSDAGITALNELTRLDPGLGDAYNSTGYWASFSMRGYALDNQGSNPPISMSVNFGNSTFTLTSNGGVDGSVRTETATNGTTLLKGQVGYTATGTVSGVTFSSSTVTTGDQGAISGKVKGAFFGPSAAAAGGVTDLTKNGARYTAPFLAVQPKYLGGGTR